MNIPINPISRIPTVKPLEGIFEKERSSQGPTEELLLILASLKRVLKELSDWIQTYPLMYSLRKTILQNRETEELKVAAKELSQIHKSFRNHLDELKCYHQQIPEPCDAAFAMEIQKALETCFLEEIAPLTRCLFAEFGNTSWGALFILDRPVHWSLSIIQVLFKEIASSKWRQVRSLLLTAL